MGGAATKLGQQLRLPEQGLNLGVCARNQGCRGDQQSIIEAGRVRGLSSAPTCAATSSQAGYTRQQRTCTLWLDRHQHALQTSCPTLLPTPTPTLCLTDDSSPATPPPAPSRPEGWTSPACAPAGAQPPPGKRASPPAPTANTAIGSLAGRERCEGQPAVENRFMKGARTLQPRKHRPVPPATPHAMPFHTTPHHPTPPRSESRVPGRCRAAAPRRAPPAAPGAPSRPACAPRLLALAVLWPPAGSLWTEGRELGAEACMGVRFTSSARSPSQ